MGLLENKEMQRIQCPSYPAAFNSKPNHYQLVKIFELNVRGVCLAALVFTLFDMSDYGRKLNRAKIKKNYTT